jgi:hypothetical protein
MKVTMFTVLPVGMVVILAVALVIEHISFGEMIHFIEGTLAFQHLGHHIGTAAAQSQQGCLCLAGGFLQGAALG